MKNLIVRSLVVAVVFIGMMIYCVAMCHTANATVVPVTHAEDEFVISSTPAGEYTPRIWGDVVIWGYRPDGGYMQLMYKHLSGGASVNITPTTTVPIDRWDISGQHIVYNTTTIGIWEYNWSEQPPSGPEHISTIGSNPSAYLNMFVWKGDYTDPFPPDQNPPPPGDPASTKVYYYDYNNLSNRGYASSTAVASLNNDIYGNLVVWTDSRTGYARIYGRYIGYAGGERAIGPPSGVDSNQDCPAVYGDPSAGNYTVVWQQAVGTQCDIYGAHVSDFGNHVQVFPIATGEANQLTPAIWGNYVIWSENGDIKGYDLQRGLYFDVTHGSPGASYPAIYENTVVWRDNRNGNPDILGNTILLEEPPPPPLAVPEPGTIALIAPALLGFAGIAFRRMRKG